MKQTFRNEERLKSSKIIKMLFGHGNSFFVHPFKVNWLPGEGTAKSPARVLIGVSRKNFRKAAQRNQVKRLCREAYRKNKYFLYEYLNDREVNCNFSLIYIGKTKEKYTNIEEKIIEVIKRLISEIEQQAEK